MTAPRAVARGWATARAAVNRTRRPPVAAGLLAVLALASCSAQEAAEPEAITSSGAPSSSSPVSRSSSTPGEPEPAASAPAPVDGPVGTVVRFTSARTSVDVTIGQDSPATRDLLSMLPLTLSVEDLSDREKISDLPRELDHAGSPGSDPEDGDLIYFTPWGNLGFYYDASGIEYADNTLHLGTYEATVEQLDLLEGGPVQVDVVR